MSKEMREQPQAVLATLLDRVGADGAISFDELRISDDELRHVTKVIW
jgi:glucosamine--fructose-6-phosphate aminotransferase (isomerizing)